MVGVVRAHAAVVGDSDASHAIAVGSDSDRGSVWVQLLLLKNNRSALSRSGGSDGDSDIGDSDSNDDINSSSRG